MSYALSSIKNKTPKFTSTDSVKVDTRLSKNKSAHHVRQSAVSYLIRSTHSPVCDAIEDGSFTQGGCGTTEMVVNKVQYGMIQFFLINCLRKTVDP